MNERIFVLEKDSKILVELCSKQKKNVEKFWRNEEVKGLITRNSGFKILAPAIVTFVR
jgi:hypothetical protein